MKVEVSCKKSKLEYYCNFMDDELIEILVKIEYDKFNSKIWVYLYVLYVLFRLLLFLGMCLSELVLVKIE